MSKWKNFLSNIFCKASIKNGIWLYLLQFFNAFIPFLTLPYITRMLGAAQYGEFNIALNFIGYLQVFVEYGFGMSATRKVVILKNDKNRMNILFTCILKARSLLCISSSILCVIYLTINHSSFQQVLCLIILFIGILGYGVQSNWIFQGMEDMKYISVINIISRCLSVALIFLFVKSSEDLLIYCLLYSISPALSGFLGLIVSKNRYGLKFTYVTFKDIVSELKEGFFVFTTQLSSKVFGAIGITFLGIFTSSVEVGIYSAIQKVPNILLLLWTPISQVLYPISSRYFINNYREGEKFVLKIRKCILPVFSFIAIIVAVFAKHIIAIVFGIEYTRFYYWIYPLLLWLLISINNNFLGIQILLASGHDKEYGKCFQISVCCTVIINFVFTYYFGGLGAAFAPLISEIVLGVLLKFKIKRIKQLTI